MFASFARCLLLPLVVLVATSTGCMGHLCADKTRGSAPNAHVGMALQVDPDRCDAACEMCAFHAMASWPKPLGTVLLPNTPLHVVRAAPLSRTTWSPRYVETPRTPLETRWLAVRARGLASQRGLAVTVLRH